MWHCCINLFYLQDLDARLKQLELLYSSSAFSSAAVNRGQHDEGSSAEVLKPASISLSGFSAAHAAPKATPETTTQPYKHTELPRTVVHTPAKSQHPPEIASVRPVLGFESSPAWTLETKTYLQERDEALVDAKLLAGANPGLADYVPGCQAQQRERLLKSSVLSSLYTPASSGYPPKPGKFKGQYDGE